MPPPCKPASETGPPRPETERVEDMPAERIRPHAGAAGLDPSTVVVPRGRVTLLRLLPPGDTCP